MSSKSSVFAIYPSRAQTDEGVEALVHARFAPADISMLMPESAGTRDLAHEKHTKAPEGTAAGAVAGGALGGALGALVATGTLAIPGLGPFIAAGPLMAALAGVGAGGTVGGVIGALAGLGMPEYEAKRYAGRLRSGGILLSVHCETGDDCDAAKIILKRTGAEDIATSGEETVSRDARGRDEAAHTSAHHHSS